MLFNSHNQGALAQIGSSNQLGQPTLQRMGRYRMRGNASFSNGRLEDVVVHIINDSERLF